MDLSYLSQESVNSLRGDHKNYLQQYLPRLAHTTHAVDTLNKKYQERKCRCHETCSLNIQSYSTTK